MAELLLCSYPDDGGTMGKLCHPPGVDREGGCVPGCYKNNHPNWCPDESRWWHCNGYPSDRLDQMLRVQLEQGQISPR